MLFSEEDSWVYNGKNISITTGGTNGITDVIIGKASPKFRRVYVNYPTPLSSNELITKQWAENSFTIGTYKFYEREISSTDNIDIATDAMVWFNTNSGNVTANLPQISSIPSGHQVRFRFSMVDSTNIGRVQPYTGDKLIAGSMFGSSIREYSYAELSNKYHYLELEKRLGENYWWVKSSRRVTFTT